MTTTPAGPERNLNTLLPPPRVWLKRLGPDERAWVTIAFIWGLILFSGMVVWRGIGEQQMPVESYRIEPELFLDEMEAFIEARQVGEEAGVPIVAPRPGENAYLQAMQFQFRPILQLQRGETYTLLVSSTDVQHGLSLQPVNLNFQVLPGYLYVLRLTPEEAGEFGIGERREYAFICNEFCGIGHHLMTGKLIVVDD